MKKLLLVVALLQMAFAAVAQPIMVGHRGSYYGVENTEEAFRNGAALGYTYLETDIKVTSDTRFILTHDDDVSRFCSSSLTIAGSTLAELQALELKQTRGGVSYTGRFMSLEEFLDLCAELGVKPLIELKWATGVSSNDQSNMPKLIEVIESKGFRNKCIILTSMTPCLEWIHNNHPDITLQYLVNSVSDATLDWCVERGIDVDIRSDGCNAEAVADFHAKGLRVNVWTANTDATYKQYGNMGCDYITTDYLDANNLPALDPIDTYPANMTDFPNLTLPLKSEYTPEIVAEQAYPEALAGLKVKRAVLKNGVWAVLAHDAQGVPTLFSLDPASGATTPISLEGLEGGNLLLSDIAFTADGLLVGCNAATVDADGGSLNFYIWNDLAAEPSLLAQVADTKMLGNFAAAYAGETFALSGRANELNIFVASRDANGAECRIAGLKVVDRELDTKKYGYAYDEAAAGSAWGNFLMNVTPTSRNKFIIDSPTMDATEYVFDWVPEGSALRSCGAIDSALVPAAATGIGFMRQGVKVYAALGQCEADGSKASARVYESVNGIAEILPVTELVGQGARTEGGLIATALEYDATAGLTYIYLFAEGQSLLKLIFDQDKPEPEPDDIELVLEQVWLNANTTENAPDHIDGSNAQQGTAVNGLFYVNDAAEQLLYIFNETGCLGSIPGGAGYGCARDDAGNIVISADASTGSSRSYIIYPAGATPDNYGAPTTLTISGMLDGQANFINASGDLLGGIGRIYIYPKDQNSANIITLDCGEFKQLDESTNLEYVGSETGYIVPNGNDIYDWYYQLRNRGVYRYKGGLNEGVLTMAHSSKPTTRNSTGGFAMPTIRGNRLIVHSSGSNYKGGFSVRNLSTDEFITNIEPIGELGSVSGGNKSTFAWIIAEKVDDSEYTIYLYCPANGMGRYRLYDRLSSGVEAVLADRAEAPLSLCLDGDSLSVGGAEGVVEIYNLAGAKLLSSASAQVNVGALAPGIYIVRTQGKAAKFKK